MYLKRFMIGFAVFGLLSVVAADAQEIFRRRPRYVAPPRSYGRLGEEQSFSPDLSRYAERTDRTSNFLTPGADGRRWQDYQRLQAIWNDYRQEAARYEARYGGDFAYASDVVGDDAELARRRCRCACRSEEWDRERVTAPFDRSPRSEGILPADRPPALYPTEQPALRPLPSSSFDPYRQARIRPSRFPSEPSRGSLSALVR